MRPYVKICGLRRLADAELAVELGASHLGCVRAPGSPRRATLEEARTIFDRFGKRAQTVVVFKDVPIELVLDEAHRAGAAGVQLHDFDENDALAAEREGFRVYRVFRLGPGSRSLPKLIPDPSEERPAMLDVGGGGSGERFDWRILGDEAPGATFIAGGVRAENVSELVRHRPYGIDLSSGVESAPGVKAGGKLRLFFDRYQAACEEVR